MAEKEFNPFLSFEEVEKEGYSDFVEKDGEEKGLRTHKESLVPVELIADPSDVLNTYSSVAGRAFKEKQRLRKKALKKRP